MSISTTSSADKAHFDEVKSLDEDVLLIDVREPIELEEFGSIPGSINIPLGTVEDVLKNMPEQEFRKLYGKDKPDLETPIIFSCRSGRRSETAQVIALELGYLKVRSYSGGWLDWEEKHKDKE